MQWWCAATGLPWSWDWQWYPGVHLALLTLLGTWWWIGRQWTVRPWGPMLLAWVLLLVTLDWPLGKLGAGYLASAHSLQFVLLSGCVAPALLRAVPTEAWLAWARRADGSLGLRPHPLLCILIHNTIVVVTHFPAIVDPAMQSQLGSFLIDVAWLVAGLVLWWPVMAPAPLRRMRVFPSIGYLLLATVVPTIPAMMMVFATWPMYELYELAPRVSVHFSPNADLQLAGFVMKLIGDLPFWGAAAAVFFTRVRAEPDA